MVGTYRRAAIRRHQVYIVRLGRLPFDFHARRSDGHARHGQPLRLWALLQEPRNVGGGNVSLKKVPADFSRVT